MSWFEILTGFSEQNPDQVRSMLDLDGETLVSRANGRSMKCGELITPSLAELRGSARSVDGVAGRLHLREVVADVGELHQDPQNAGALFQVASQFNLLEMVGPSVIPEKGVGIYDGDPTQGPRCAIAAGAATIYRNYFVPVQGQIGQTADRQIDCLADVGTILRNDDERLWRMRNGYAQPVSEAALKEIYERLTSAGADELDTIRQALRIGIHRDVEVTQANAGHTVTQAFCSAMPLGAYSPYPSELWEPFARVVLEAAYEATICAAIVNASRTGSDQVYLTLLGGGVFGNDREWIFEAIERALSIYRSASLDVAIVSYGWPDERVAHLIAGLA